MKRSEMNVNQRLLFDTMCYVMSDIIGGCENNLLDYSEDEEEYIEAKKYLSQSHDELKEDIYQMTISEFNKDNQNAKFAGKKFLLERIEKRLVKWGY